MARMAPPPAMDAEDEEEHDDAATSAGIDAIYTIVPARQAGQVWPLRSPPRTDPSQTPATPTLPHHNHCHPLDAAPSYPYAAFPPALAPAFLPAQLPSFWPVAPPVPLCACGFAVSSCPHCSSSVLHRPATSPTRGGHTSGAGAPNAFSYQRVLGQCPPRTQAGSALLGRPATIHEPRRWTPAHKHPPEHSNGAREPSFTAHRRATQLLPHPRDRPAPTAPLSARRIDKHTASAPTRGSFTARGRLPDGPRHVSALGPLARLPFPAAPQLTHAVPLLPPMPFSVAHRRAPHAHAFQHSSKQHNRSTSAMSSTTRTLVSASSYKGIAHTSAVRALEEWACTDGQLPYSPLTPGTYVMPPPIHSRGGPMARPALEATVASSRPSSSAVTLVPMQQHTAPPLTAPHAYPAAPASHHAPSLSLASTHSYASTHSRHSSHSVASGASYHWPVVVPMVLASPVGEEDAHVGLVAGASPMEEWDEQASTMRTS